MDLGEHVTRFRFLVPDRAGQFAASFDAVLADSRAFEVVKIPPRCPARQLSFAERLVLTVRKARGHRPHAYLFGERRSAPGACRVRRPLQQAAARHRALRLRPPRPTSPVPEQVHGGIRRAYVYSLSINAGV